MYYTFREENRILLFFTLQTCIGRLKIAWMHDIKCKHKFKTYSMAGSGDSISIK